jgi:hypothetical protein
VFSTEWRENSRLTDYGPLASWVATRRTGAKGTSDGFDDAGNWCVDREFAELPKRVPTCALNEMHGGYKIAGSPVSEFAASRTGKNP